MIYNMPGVAGTVDFDEIMRGYFLNDGDHNPHGIISQRPHIDWSLDPRKAHHPPASR
jgi:putative glutathione S-transferase